LDQGNKEGIATDRKSKNLLQGIDKSTSGDKRMASTKDCRHIIGFCPY
jgi:hypothetical protein